jgi:F-type H+-transporting ATPase subunit b
VTEMPLHVILSRGDGEGSRRPSSFASLRMTWIFILLLLFVAGGVIASEQPSHNGEGAHADMKWGLPTWIWKLLNMILFVGVLVYFVGGPVKKAFAERGEAIRNANDEARERRAKADLMASDIQRRLEQIEQEVRSIRQRAEAEGERQKRDLMAAAEVEAAKILQAARSEVDARLKNARQELTEYAGQLASDRAEAILRERINETDQKKIFQESLREVSEA